MSQNACFSKSRFGKRPFSCIEGIFLQTNQLQSHTGLRGAKAVAVTVSKTKMHMATQSTTRQRKEHACANIYAHTKSRPTLWHVLSNLQAHALLFVVGIRAAASPTIHFVVGFDLVLCAARTKLRMVRGGCVHMRCMSVQSCARAAS